MKRSLAAWMAALLLVAAGSASLFAQASTFDIATFAAPPGWTKERSADHLVLTSIDNAKRVFCQLVVYVSQPASGEPLTDFATEWDAVVANGFTVKSRFSPAQGRTAAGVSYVEAGSDVEVNGGKYYARLTVFLVNGRAQSVLALATDSAVFKTYAGQVTPFFASFRFAAQAGSGSRDIGAFRGKGIAGVWMTFTTMRGSDEPTPRWMTLFTDGQIYDDIPREGLDNFDRAASKADEHQAGYWGTYTWNGSSGSVSMPRVIKPWPVAAETQTKITVGNSGYAKCPDVDGLRLQGSWTSYADPTDPSLATLPAGQKPVISFSKDGRFNDEGLFLAFLHSASADKSAEGPGNGTYEVKDYTLVLRYADGRVKAAAISGLLSADPATNSQYLYVERSRLTRMK